MAKGEWDEPLSALRWHWDKAYTIHNPAPDVWIAVLRDTRETLRDTTPLSLRDFAFCAAERTRLALAAIQECRRIRW